MLKGLGLGVAGGALALSGSGQAFGRSNDSGMSSVSPACKLLARCRTDENSQGGKYPFQ